jgi:Phosphotransferase enzyme family
VTVDVPKAEEMLAGWIERTVGGKVVRIQRLARWRPAWDIDVERAGAVMALHARGERELNFAIPWRIADEVATHDLLERAGLPVPHAYGLCEEPYALVMDRLAGFVDVSFARSDEERFDLIEEYLELQAKIYGIDLADAAAAGFDCPTDARGIALGAFMRFEQAYDALVSVPDPVTEFLRRWLHRNYPPDRARARFITYDAFQFMFAGGRITGLLDFELSHVGDPMMDLAALRIRDTIKNFDDLPAIAARYAEVTGEVVDHDVVDYHTVMYNAITVLSASPPLAAPVDTTDLMSHMAWYVNSARWAFEVMADILGIELASVDPPAARPSRHRAAFQHLANGTRRPVGRDEADYQRATLHRVARHVLRIDEVGREIEEADVDDLGALLGLRPRPEKADEDLLGFIAEAGPEQDEALVRLLDRRVQRQHLLMAPEGSLMLRHPRLRSLRPGTINATRDEDRWPPGAIPGTG